MSKDLTPSYSFELVEEPENGSSAALATDRPRHRSARFPDGEEEGGVALRRHIAALLRYKWWIVLITIVGTGVGFGATRFVAPEYQTRATLWIETGTARAERAGPIRPDELLESSSWIELLRSALVLEPVVRELQLFLQPDQPADSVLLAGMRFDERFAAGRYRLRATPSSESYVLETTAGAVVERGAFGDSVGRVLGIRWAPDLAGFPAERAVGFSLAAPRDVSNALRNRISAELDRNGNFLRLTLDGEDPRRIAAILNAVTERYIEVAADLKRARLDELVAILEGQVEYAEQRLRSAEIALEDFRVQTVTLPSERSTPVAPGLQITQDPVFGSFFGMQVELEQIRQEQEAIEDALRPGSDPSLNGLRAVPAIQQSPETTAALQELTGKQSELRALRYRYTDEHPPVQTLVGEIEILETQTIPALARQVLAQLQAEEGQLEQRVASASRELERIPPRAIEETRLERSVQSADNLYSTLLRRYEEARLSAASSIPDVRVLDAAVVPRQPIRNQGPQLILLAMLGSLGLGIAGALLRDRMDSRLHYPDQVSDELGLTILAGLPRLRSGGRVFGRDNTAQAQEAFRTLRLNLMYAYGSAGPLVTTISSPGPGDGKSFVAANLARAFAEIGKKTLLIDGDTRRGQLHEILGLERKPGLVDLLQDDPSAEPPPIKTTGYSNLFLLPSGSRLQGSPELLSSARMRQLIVRLRSSFDVIIVDSPPLGAGVDPFVLSTLTGSMLMVLRTGETDRELADAKLELLERLPVRLLGAVLNGVPRSRDYRYYSYTAGYEPGVEEPADDAALIEK